MEDTPASLAHEAEALRRQARVAATGSPASGRVAAARARFLPYAIVGGVAFSVVAGAVAAGQPGKDAARPALVFGVTAGILLGMFVGWFSLRLLERFVWRRSPRRLALDAGIVATTVPGYVVGCWTAALGTLIAMPSSGADATAKTVPNIWPLILVSAAVIYPLSYLFARRDLDRPTTFVAAVTAALDEPNAGLRSPNYGILVRPVLATVWTFASLVGLAMILVGVQALAPEAYQAAVDRTLGPFLVAFLVAWVGLTIAGTSLTLRGFRRLQGRWAGRGGR
jgi:hypothetical protein